MDESTVRLVLISSAVTLFWIAVGMRYGIPFILPEYDPREAPGARRGPVRLATDTDAQWANRQAASGQPSVSAQTRTNIITGALFPMS